MTEGFFTYYTTGVYAVVEKLMIFFLIAFLGWNVRLFVEKEPEGSAEGRDEQK